MSKKNLIVNFIDGKKRDKKKEKNCDLLQSTYAGEGGGGVQAKAFVHCFGDVLKCVQGGGGEIFDLFKRTYFIDGPLPHAGTFS